MNEPFPPVDSALTEPNGLVAVGGDLSIERLKDAYSHGIFPWFMEGDPILWWSPDPRTVIYLDKIKISRSLKKILRNQDYQVTIDQAFEDVIKNCRAPRKYQPETWITNEMERAYCGLHNAGMAHSIEVWRNPKLIGGLYGVDCGRIFTGESMFSLESNASKIALVYLTKYLELHHYYLLDCQLDNPFLKQFGTQHLERSKFVDLLQKGLKDPPTDIWKNTSQFDFDRG